MNKQATYNQFRAHTIVYVCLQCGELIHNAMAPCLYCGKYPKNIEDVAAYHLLNSQSQSFDLLLPLARIIKQGDDYTKYLPNWDRTHHSKAKELSVSQGRNELIRDYPLNYVGTLLSRMYVRCAVCNEIQFIALGESSPCIRCRKPSGVSTKQCWIIALSRYLRFITDYEIIVKEEDRPAFEMAIGIGLRMLNDLIEGYEDLPEEINDQFRAVLWQVKAVGVNNTDFSFRLTPGERIKMFTGRSNNEEVEEALTIVCASLTYILLESLN